MIENLSEYLFSIAIGIRFRANFALEDKLGNIVDDILYSTDSFFNPDFFPEVASNVNEKTLFHRENENRLTINNSNFILEVNLAEFDQKSIDQINNRFNEDIIKGVLKKYKVTQINRIGYIHRYSLGVGNIAENFIDKTIGTTLEDIKDINLRFSKKLVIEDALISKNVNDYHNVIYNIVKKSDEDDLLVSIDYQRYYDPFLESSAGIEFDKFIATVNTFNKKSITDWLNQNYGKINEAA